MVTNNLFAILTTGATTNLHADSLTIYMNNLKCLLTLYLNVIHVYKTKWNMCKIGTRRGLDNRVHYGG